jgi:hypothetical protein
VCLIVVLFVANAYLYMNSSSDLENALKSIINSSGTKGTS